MAGRKFFVGGNWKCNGSKKSIDDLINILNGAQVPGTDVVEVIVSPTFLHIPHTLASLRRDFSVAAQDCWIKGNGAYTGEVSADMLVDVGLHWVILGHSERRHIIGESDEMTADKVAYAISKGLSVIYCIGEKLEERENDSTVDVCTRQMEALSSKLSPSDWSKIVVAYEPVWAIGTGKVATPEQAQQVHEAIRSWFATAVTQEVAAATRIIYGGSVNAANCKELAGQKDIDGFLVGGASLKAEFIDIVNSAAAS